MVSYACREATLQLCKADLETQRQEIETEGKGCVDAMKAAL